MHGTPSCTVSRVNIANIDASRGSRFLSASSIRSRTRCWLAGNPILLPRHVPAPPYATTRPAEVMRVRGEPRPRSPRSDFDDGERGGGHGHGVAVQGDGGGGG